LTPINKSAFQILSLCDGQHTFEKLSQKYNSDIKEIVNEFITNANRVGTIELSSVKKASNLKILGTKDFWIPIVVVIELTYKCPLFCQHCYRECSMKRTESDRNKGYSQNCLYDGKSWN
jgi:hypothetical protein